MDTPNQTQEPATTEEGQEGESFDFLHPLYLVFGLLGIFGNGLVIFVLIRVRSLRNVTNLLIGNQSLIDLMTSVLLLFGKYREENTDFSRLSRGLGIFVCFIWTTDYIFWSLVFASTANLVVITLDRYLAVMKPLMHRQRVNLAVATKVSFLPWVFGFVSQIYWPAVFRLRDGVCYHDWRQRWIQTIVGTMVVVVTFILPVVIIIVVYTSILRKLRNKVGTETNIPPNAAERQHGQGRQDGNHGRQDPNNRNTGSDVNKDQKIRNNVMKTLVLVALVFIICWTPNQTIYLLWNVGLYDAPYGSILISLSVALAFCNMWINPFIYTFQYRRFQRGLRQVFCSRGCQTDTIGISTTNTGTR